VEENWMHSEERIKVQNGLNGCLVGARIRSFARLPHKRERLRGPQNRQTQDDTSIDGDATERGVEIRPTGPWVMCW
jgi:hypothetical protein